MQKVQACLLQQNTDSEPEGGRRCTKAMLNLTPAHSASLLFMHVQECQRHQQTSYMDNTAVEECPNCRHLLAMQAECCSAHCSANFIILQDAFLQKG